MYVAKLTKTLSFCIALAFCVPSKLLSRAVLSFVVSVRVLTLSQKHEVGYSYVFCKESVDLICICFVLGRKKREREGWGGGGGGMSDNQTQAGHTSKEQVLISPLLIVRRIRYTVGRPAFHSDFI